MGWGLRPCWTYRSISTGSCPAVPGGTTRVNRTPRLSLFHWWGWVVGWRGGVGWVGWAGRSWRPAQAGISGSLRGMWGRGDVCVGGGGVQVGGGAVAGWDGWGRAVVEALHKQLQLEGGGSELRGRKMTTEAPTLIAGPHSHPSNTRTRAGGPPHPAPPTPLRSPPAPTRTPPAAHPPFTHAHARRWIGSGTTSRRARTCRPRGCAAGAGSSSSPPPLST